MSLNSTEFTIQQYCGNNEHEKYYEQQNAEEM